MAGYLSSSFFFFRVYGQRWSRVEKHKRRTRLTSSHLERASLVNKGVIISKKEHYFFRDTAGNPERQDRAFLLARVFLANNSVGFG